MGLQYMVPTERTNQFTISVIVGAVINLFLNLVLIKSFQSIGAAIATVLAEIAVAATQIYFLRDDIKIITLLPNIGKYLFSSLIMFIPVMLMGYFFGANAKTTFMQIITGAITYVLVLFLLKSDINNFIFSRLFGKVYRKLSSRRTEA